MAYVNPRVRSFSQYLMSDDTPRASEFNRYAGFESGLRTNKGKKKPAYKAFRLPLAVESYGRNDVLWGLVRQHRAGDQGHDRGRPAGQEGLPEVQDARPPRAPACSRCGSLHEDGRSYRVRWTSPEGKTYRGASVRAY